MKFRMISMLTWRYDMEKIDMAIAASAILIALFRIIIEIFG